MGWLGGGRLLPAELNVSVKCTNERPKDKNEMEEAGEGPLTERDVATVSAPAIIRSPQTTPSSSCERPFGVRKFWVNNDTLSLVSFPEAYSYA